MNYSYSYNDSIKELTIYEDNMILATVSDVSPNSIENIFKDILFELRGIDK